MEARSAPVFCRAALNYVAPPDPAGPEGAGGPLGRLGATVVEIADGRSAALPGWEVCGFQLMTDGSAVGSWDDDDEIATVHYPEAEALVRRVTGCQAALVSDHVRRKTEPRPGQRDQTPVHLVHSDFAPGYDEVVRTAYHGVKGRGAATLARSGLTAERIESAGRVVMIQLWRNVGPARMDYPLAFCDARTVTPAETRPFRYTGYVAGGRSFDALAVTAPDDPDRHHWYTFPDMTPDEVVVFRTYDTTLVARGLTHFTPHSAFRDPRVEVGRPSRFSIELRVMCLFF